MEIAHEQKYVDMVDAFMPTEAIRRRPGFDIRKWREEKPLFREIVAKHERIRRGPRKS